MTTDDTVPETERVRLVYERENDDDGTPEEVELPFLVGVMADLSGNAGPDLPKVPERRFADVPRHGFDDFMAETAPRARFTVGNTLTGEGELEIDFAPVSIGDFSPAGVARQVPPLAELLEARTRLAALLRALEANPAAAAMVGALVADAEALAAVAEGGEPDLGPLAAAAEGAEAPDEDTYDLDALMGVAEEEDGFDLDALLSDDGETGDTDLDALLGGDDTDPDLDALLAGETEEEAPAASDDFDLDSLLAEADTGEAGESAEAGEEDTDLDSLLAGLDDEPAPDATDDTDTDLDSLLDGSGDDTEAAAGGRTKEDDLRFGTLTASKPDAARTKFRIAIMGDFSGRANRGALESGDALGARKAFRFDIDNAEDMIARFATTLTLPVGRDGAAVEVRLNGLDDLHPDQLYDNVEVFSELSGLRQSVKMGRGLSDLKEWGELFGQTKLKPKGRAKGSKVPARKRETFADLLGEGGAKLSATPADELIQRIVGPHVVAAPDPGQASMLKAVDDALGTAMRAILHHPDFQAVESTWRSLDLIARKVETGGGMEMVLYDVAAEELAADLAEHDELSESGLYKLLAEKPLEDAREGRLAAIIGLYTFDEIPPHAELLGRMAKIAAHIDAPFFASITTDYLNVKMEDRHELTAEAWDALRELPEAKYIGLATPRFLLRHPYGAKTDPIDPFDFEEFTLTGGLSGMLWANPAVLVAILLAETAVQGGKNMSLGKVMSLGEMPYYWITDQYGDQVALPCTERLLSQRMAEDTVVRGYMPVLSIKGRDVVRLGGFNSVGGGEILGPWASGEGAAVSSAKRQRMESSIGFGAGLAAGTGAKAGGGGKARPGEELIDIGGGMPGEGEDDDDDSGFGSDDDDFDLGGGDDLDLGGGDDDLGLDLGGGGDDDDGGLDALLAGFDEDAAPDAGGDDDMDDELAALLKDLA